MQTSEMLFFMTPLSSLWHAYFMNKKHLKTIKAIRLNIPKLLNFVLGLSSTS